MSAYGDGLLLRGKEDDSLTVTATSPAIWLPVVDPRSLRRIQHHVLVFSYCADRKKKIYHLSVEIHTPREPGMCERHEYELTGPEGNRRIGREVKSKEDNPVADIELHGCPVHRIANIPTSDRVFGLDDYTPIDSIISELIVRISQIGNVLDKHANPSMSGPASALTHDPDTGSWRLLVGDYFPRNSKDDPVPEYVTWDGSLAASFKQVEVLINALYSISEMGAFLFVHLNADKIAVQNRGNFFILKAFALHNMAPVASGITDAQKYGLIFSFCFLEGFLAPWIPVHGVVNVLKEVA